MSGGIACGCLERQKPLAERDWVVSQYLCNHSAFNGYHRTPSDYSTVRCNQCSTLWRSKGKFVDELVALGKVR